MHQEEYKGRVITVDILERQNGWTWNYQIDGGSFRRCGDRPHPSEELALSEALQEAKYEID